jgi:hypothetical protein
LSRQKVTLLVAERVVFCSDLDESAFFKWLENIKCVKGVGGVGDAIHITVVTKQVDECGLRELLALFKRYKISMGQLGAFDNPGFSDWFHNKKAYWYKQIFGNDAN